MNRVIKICFRVIEKLTPELAENIKGDLEEIYLRHLKKHGKRKATLLFIIECFTCLKLIFNKEIPGIEKSVGILTSLKISWRILWKNKSYSLISLSGLTIGLTASAIVFLFVRTELSYDRYHKKSDLIYRVIYDLTEQNENLPWAISTGKWAPMITDQFPEALQFVRISPTWGSKSLIKAEKNSKGSYEEGFVWADSTIVDVFDIEIIAGDEKNPIAQPYTILIDEEMAIKHFGSVDEALNKTLSRDNETDYKVTAVFKKMPVTSHFHARIIASFMSGTTQVERSKFWTYSFILLDKDADIQKVTAGLPAMIKPHIQSNSKAKLNLQPLTSIYLDSQLMYEFEPVGNRTTVQLFIGIGIFIILIASINFVNLATAYGAKRTKEIGLKKVMGAHRNELIRQLITESILITIGGVLTAGLCTYLLLPTIELLINKPLDTSMLWTIENIIRLIGFTFLIGLLSGIYPALYISAHQPSEIFGMTRSKGKQLIRKGLSVFQFAMSIALVAGSIVVYQQLMYFQEMDMGMQTEQALVIPLDYSDNINDNYKTFRSELMRDPNIINMSMMSNLPGELIRMWVGNIRLSHASDEEKLRVKIFNTDYDFVNTLGIRIKEGRDYSRSFATDSSHAVLINETAAQALGISNLDSASIYSYSPTQKRHLKVIGIVEDFHFASLHNTIEPLVIYNNAKIPGGKLVIKVDTQNLSSTLDHVEKVWSNYEPDRPIESYFLNEYFQTKYTKEQTIMKLLISFTIIAIFIACMGLFGLATYVLQSRLKEIGIRKILGASPRQLWLLLTAEFMWLIMIAFVIISPFAYYLLNNWLSNFAYQIELNALVFIFSVLTVIIPAVIIVSMRSLRIANLNPTETLTTE